MPRLLLAILQIATAIQGRRLIEGGVYCTEAPSMWLLFRSSLGQVRSQPCMLVCLTRCFQELKYDLQ